MDSDRELLELAAKAVGYELEWEEVGEDDPDCGPCWFCVIRGTRAIWDPLTNDGDALRLAGALGLVVDCSRPSAGLPYVQHAIWLDEMMGTAELIRRAIVRAAAEIGREPGGRNG